MSNQTNSAAGQATIVGGWSPYHTPTPQEMEVFNQAMEGFVGVHYDPTAVSTQVVNGTNYRFRCTASMPPSEVVWEAIVEIYAPIGGMPHVIGITRI